MWLIEKLRGWLRGCAECRSRSDLKRWTTCSDGFVCPACRLRLGYDYYLQSLREEQ
jgi:hypothetical protein